MEAVLIRFGHSDSIIFPTWKPSNQLGPHLELEYNSRFNLNLKELSNDSSILDQL